MAYIDLAPLFVCLFKCCSVTSSFKRCSKTFWHPYPSPHNGLVCASYLSHSSGQSIPQDRHSDTCLVRCYCTCLRSDTADVCHTYLGLNQTHTHTYSTPHFTDPVTSDTNWTIFCMFSRKLDYLCHRVVLPSWCHRDTARVPHRCHVRSRGVGYTDRSTPPATHTNTYAHTEWERLPKPKTRPYDGQTR